MSGRDGFIVMLFAPRRGARPCLIWRVRRRSTTGQSTMGERVLGSAQDLVVFDRSSQNRRRSPRDAKYPTAGEFEREPLVFISAALRVSRCPGSACSITVSLTVRCRNAWVLGRLTGRNRTRGRTRPSAQSVLHDLRLGL